MKRSWNTIIATLSIAEQALFWAIFGYFYLVSPEGILNRQKEIILGSLFLCMAFLTACLVPGIWQAKKQWQKRGRATKGRPFRAENMSHPEFRNPLKPRHFDSEGGEICHPRERTPVCRSTQDCKLAY